MDKKEKTKSPRVYMELAIQVMNDSIQEHRDDKVSPKVGAVLIKPDGSVDTASRGELREGDHAEFTLLERKNRAVPLSVPPYLPHWNHAHQEPGNIPN